MAIKCCVPGCDTYSGQGIKLHRFPYLDEDVYTEYIRRIGNNKLLNLSPIDVYKSYRVCDKHFSEHSRIPEQYKHKSGLIYRSLPTLYLPDFNEEPTKKNSILPFPNLLDMPAKVGQLNMNCTPILESVFSVNEIKEEKCLDNDFQDDKVHISETAVTTDNPELQNNLICDEMKQYDKFNTLDNIKTELSSSEVQYGIVHGNLKIEEGIGANDIKVEFNNGQFYCEHCHAYYSDYCIECGMLVHILNKTVPINAESKSQELPIDILEIHDYFGQYGICALKSIPVGVKFGPFSGLNRTESPWKIKGGTFVVDKDKSKYLNWMQYINPARNISEQNLRVFQYEHNLYYESTCQIQEGDELLVYFGEKYENSLNRNVRMDFSPTIEDVLKDVFACTYCCFGFSSKSYLVKHKAICPGNVDGEFTVEELMQCPACKIHFDQREYFMHHMTYCCERNDTKYNQMTVASRDKTRPSVIHKCQQCKYRTKYKGELENHTILHYEGKLHKCGICCRRFKTKEVLRLHVETTHIHVGGAKDSEHSTEDHVKVHLNVQHSHKQDEMKPLMCSSCDFRPKHQRSLKRHMAEKHLKGFNYMCDTCNYKTTQKSTLKRHIATIHLKVFKYKCDTCDYKTNRTDYLKTHIETKHLKEFKYKCETCDYKSNRKFSLRAHIETKHLKEFKYKCDRCDYKTNVKCSLTTHVEAKHLKEFKYKCDTCDYKTNVKSLLKTHVDTRHLKEIKYKCDTCDYETHWKFYLKIHVETKHLKRFKYNCAACDYKTNVKSSLKTHIATKHLRELKYKCDTCEYKTNQKHHLKRHVEARHLKEFKHV